MIDYATWCAIRDGVATHLNATQLAERLGLDVRTVRHWMNRPYAPRASVKRPSKLDPFKGRIVGWLDAYPLSSQQVFQRLCDAGYEGGISIVKDYVTTIRPRHREAFLALAFAPGDVAQVDWGEFKTITVGNTRRRLSFFVMVLAWSRQMYVEFTLSQTMEQFLSAHINAFNALGVPRRVMVDNALSHVRKIVALAEIHGDDAVIRAITDAIAYSAFSSEYIAHIIGARSRQLPDPGPLILMRQQDVLDLELPPPDLSVYSALTAENEEENHEDNRQDEQPEP